MTNGNLEEIELEPHQRDRAKESQIMLWIWNVLGEISSTDYDQFLRDGVILCRLINALKPGTIKEDLENATMRQKQRNIELFLNACKSFGVDKNLLFKSEDLLYLRNIPRVTRCIFALGKKCQLDGEYEGPDLGDEPYEPVGKAGRRRGGLPLGDDIYLAHIKIDKITNMLPVDGRMRRESLKHRISLYNF